VLSDASHLIGEIAAALEADSNTTLESNPRLVSSARAVGEQCHVEHASAEQLMREYGALAEVLEDFVADEVLRHAQVDGLAASAVLRRVSEALRVLQRHSVAALVANYTKTLERQTTQLRTFSRLVSHEIRQPLSVLQVITRALPVTTADPEAVRMMDIFDRSVVRLTEVTGKLERLARITRETDLLPSERTVDLTEVVRSVADQLMSLARERDVAVHVRPDLPTVRLDPARAELIFLNLIANAIKHADPDKPTRYVEIYSGGGSEPNVIVRDNGLGMTPPRLQTVFREFVRAHAQRDDEVRAWGLGLGLTIVRECMDHAGGSVRVDSIEGRGTTFKLTWPTSAVR
jgi:signal transduction histidine kinase